MAVVQKVLLLDYGRISPPGDTQTDRAAVETAGVRKLGLPTIGNGNGGSGIRVVGDVRHPPQEHSHTVYRDHTHFVSLSGSGSAPWSAGDLEVVVTG